MLIVFGGLPGVGKSAIAQQVSREAGAVYLRIDTIEQALVRQGMKVWAEGYEIAYVVAAENLRLGRTVVADSVNPLNITRDRWAELGAAAGIRVVEIELFCSDAAEHRHRVETRQADINGHKLPAWDAVLNHHYQAWDRPHEVVDTAGRNVPDVVCEIMRKIGR